MMLARFLVLLLFAGCCTAASAVTELSGQTAGGAYYRIEVPQGWVPDQGLVLFNRGLRGTAPGPNPGLGPLRELHLQQGYALAASSYALNSWSLFTTVNDYRELLEVFRENFGEPAEIFVYGGSLGGLISLQLAEQRDLGNIVGAYALCPPAAGSRVWDAAMDMRLIYDTVCGDSAQRRLPGGSGPYRFMLDSGDISPEVESLSGVRILSSLGSCVGLEVPSWLQTSGMSQRLARIMALVGIRDEEFFALNMAYALFGLSDLYRDPAKLNEALAFDNRFVDYGDAEINANIHRAASQPFQRLALTRNWTPSGRVGNVKVLSTTTDKDDLVVVENQHELARRVPASQLAQGIIVEEEPSHCGYELSEVTAGWELLREWVAGAPQPDATDMQQRCLQLQADGVQGACRYDPDFEVQPLDTRIRPRGLPERNVDALNSGLWHDPSRPGEGWTIEYLGNGNALVYWFTYPVQGEPGLQEWVIAQGRVLDNAILLDESFTARGGVFGPGFDPDTVELRPWGSLELLFEACGAGQLRYVGPDGYGTAIRQLQQLTHVGAQRCPEAGPAAQPSPGPTHYSGSWFSPQRIGEGINLQWQDDGRAFVLWFSYDLGGNPLWLIGEGEWDGESLNFNDSLLRPMGTIFGDALDPDAVIRPSFGSMRLRFDTCDAATMQYSGPNAFFGGGEIALRRLSVPAGLSGCGT